MSTSHNGSVASRLPSVMCAVSLLFAVSCGSRMEGIDTRPRCPSRGPSEIASDTTHRSSVHADFDGNRRADLMTIYALASERTVDNVDEPGTRTDPDPVVRVRVETDDGAVIDERLPWWGAYTEIFVATDLNRDDKAEAWVDPRNGATAHSLGMVVFVDCRARQVKADDGHGPAEFLHAVTGNASTGVTVGIECSDIDADGTSEIVTTEHDEQSSWWSYAAYRLEGNAVRVTRKEEGRTLPSPENVALRWDGGLHCEQVAVPDDAVRSSRGGDP